MNVLVINGPNINMLGLREPNIYGKVTYKDLVDMINNHAKELNIDVSIYQSNHEGDIVDQIQLAYGKYDYIVMNPGAYTHTSIAILDALKSVMIPCIEVHISDVKKRESFRQISYIRDYCFETIMGEGVNGYLHALDIIVSKDK